MFDSTLIYILLFLNRSALSQIVNTIARIGYNISSDHANKLVSPKPIDPLMIIQPSYFLILYAKNVEH